VWVKEKDIHHFGYRPAIAVITRNDTVDAGLPVEAFYKLLGLPEFSEDFMRIILRAIYGDISKWILCVAFYDVSKDAWLVRVESPDFEVVPTGAHPPEIERKLKTHGE
jgi:hypothetical protein